MDIKLAPNPLCAEVQSLSFKKIATLIGENGSGKSSILQEIFNSKMNRDDYHDIRIVCFSSGQNESFSEPFTRYLHREREIEKPINLSCFYYDKLLSKLLIFLATSLFPKGLVRNFLRKNRYVDEEYVAESQYDDQSTTLNFRFSVPRKYVERVQKALEEEEEGGKSILRSTPFFRSLESFIEMNVDASYDFSEPLSPVTVELTARKLIAASYAHSSPGENDTGARDVSNDNPTVRFFTQASDDDYFINRSKLLLTLRGGIELDQLSDGEYQILFIFALVDLFDSPETLFLFDEADSHLHYKNISKLWKTFKSIDGKVITTTHLLDSITANSPEEIKVVTDGKISEERNKLDQIIRRLDVLSNASFYEYDVCSMVDHIALLDDCNDWEIFVRLAHKKGLNCEDLMNVHALKKTSSYGSISEEFAKGKFDWVEGFKRCQAITTSNIFLICDADVAKIEYDKQNGVRVTGKNIRNKIRKLVEKTPLKLFLLAWKRREIKNYLLSYTALKQYGVIGLVNNDDIPRKDYLAKHDPGDNDSIRRMKAKDVVNPLINDPDGLSFDKLQSYINHIPAEEISEDIVNMYNFIVGKLRCYRLRK